MIEATNFTKMIPSTAFYNFIASDYNGHMTESDETVRNHVIKTLINTVPDGSVLDFGGGTGLDLQSLIYNRYKVHFLEPSPHMRAIAKKTVPENAENLIVIEENIDFHNWSADNLPFNEKMNGILANFAVLNCIEDIELLFEKLSLISTPHCKIVATVIDTLPAKMIEMYSLKVAIKSFLNIPLSTQNSYKGVTQKTFLHTKLHYKNTSAKYFNFISYSSIKSSHFAILILSKK
ncbi:MAG TPA: class I SAM-dependent methyltransferase [Puia sp.]|nr:class I SAM-dependent methyltransferase [Puia sp.]